MPLLNDSAYTPPLLLRNGHLQTIYPALLRKVTLPDWRRERMATADADFIDLDWLCHKRGQSQSALLPPLAILSHGLEGSSAQGYIRGMARALYNQGWDVLAWNFRGCSGTPNHQLRSYHSGATDDLQPVINHAALAAPFGTDVAENSGTSLTRSGYRDIALVGFSLGGNIVLKYLGELSARAKDSQQASSTLASNRHDAQQADTATSSATTGQQADEGASPIPAARKTAPKTTATDSLHQAAHRIIGTVAISVPCDLAGSTTVLERRANRIYMERFLKTLRQKIREKHRQFPSRINIDGLDAIRTFREFDGRYTAPIHGFASADHYWHSCSCLRSIEQISVPTLLINAADDPFLSSGCYPSDIAREHAFLHLEIPHHGGHVGFVRRAADGLYYSELRACAFLEAALHNLDTAQPNAAQCINRLP